MSEKEALIKGLTRNGYTESQIADFILPDWWDDALWENRTAIAELRLMASRITGVSLRELQPPPAPPERSADR